MDISNSKSQIIHFRKSTRKKSSFNFDTGNGKISVVKRYKYLGVILKECSDLLEEYEGRAHCSIISKSKSLEIPVIQLDSVISGILAILNY